MIHFTSDTHWHHANVIRYSDRPYSSVEEMNKALIQNWNRQVDPADTVWHLGDLAFCQYPQLVQILKQLNGRKNLVLGNHDRVVEQNRDRLLSSGLVDSIQSYAELRSDEHPFICLFHYGMRVWNKSHHGSIMLYGHSHGSLPPWGKSVDVGVDSKEISHEYRPYSLTEILQYMEPRGSKQVDHHEPRNR